MRIITIKMPDELHKAIIAARPNHNNKAFIEVIRDYIRLGLVLDNKTTLKMYVEDPEVLDADGKPVLTQLTWE